MTREPKKTEMLEIRVSSETKLALQAKARADGKSVSEVLRQLIANYLTPEPLAHQRRRNMMRLSSFAAGAAALALCAAAVTPPAAAGMLRGLAPLADLPTEPNSAGLTARDRRALRRLEELRAICDREAQAEAARERETQRNSDERQCGGG